MYFRCKRWSRGGADHTVDLRRSPDEEELWAYSKLLVEAEPTVDISATMQYQVNEI